MSLYLNKMLSSLLNWLYCCTQPKMVATVAFGGMILAQEIPTQFDWAKLPIETACVGALFWVATRTMPALFERQIAAQQTQHEKYRTDLSDILKTQETAFDKLATALTNKVDKQVDLMQKMIAHTDECPIVNKKAGVLS